MEPFCTLLTGQLYNTCRTLFVKRRHLLLEDRANPVLHVGSSPRDMLALFPTLLACAS